MAKARVDCSELAKNVTELAMLIGAEPDVKNLDDVVAKIQVIPGLEALTREEVARSIAEATQGKQHTLSELAQKLAEIKREARLDARTRKRIKELQQHIKLGTLPDARTNEPGEESDVLRELRELRDSLQKQIGESPTSQERRIQKSIGEIHRRLQEQDYAPHVKPPKATTNRLLTLRHEQLILRRELNHRIQRSGMSRIRRAALELSAAPKAMAASLDLSWTLRQGFVVALAHPSIVAKAFPKQLKAWTSAAKQQAIQDEILHRTNAPFYDGRLDIIPLDKSASLADQEEVFQSHWATKIPGLGWLYSASERAYVTMGNVVRADYFDLLAQPYIDNPSLAAEELNGHLDRLAHYVNVATGRGARVLGSVGDFTFWSQRFTMSRIQFLAGDPLIRSIKDPKVAKTIAKEYGRALGSAFSLVALFYLSGFEMELDWRSSDFSKIKFGNTRIDWLAGFSQHIVFFGRMATGESKSPRTKRITDLDDPGFGRRNRLDVFTDTYFWYKLAPLPSAIANVVRGETVVGEKRDIATIGGIAALGGDLFLPLSGRDIYEGMKDLGLSDGTIIGIFNILGVGSQTHTERREHKREKKKPVPVPAF